MLKEAIEKIVELAAPTVISVEDKTFSNGSFTEVKPRRYRPEPITLNTIDGVTRLIREEAVPKYEVISKIFVTVDKYNHIEVYTSYDGEEKRSYLYCAQADVPGFREGFRDRETMIVQLRSLFLQTEDVAYLLNLISKMTDEEKVTSNDNGVTQTVEAKKGIALKEKIDVKSRAKLTPFRTFLEVDQPESEFILRVNQAGEIGLFEADGGVWKLVAKRTIKKKLEDALKDLIEQGKVVVLM